LSSTINIVNCLPFVTTWVLPRSIGWVRITYLFSFRLCNVLWFWFVLFVFVLFLICRTLPSGMSIDTSIFSHVYLLVKHTRFQDLAQSKSSWTQKTNDIKKLERNKISIYFTSPMHIAGYIMDRINYIYFNKTVVHTNIKMLVLFL
jgi:hypothetical protein